MNDIFLFSSRLEMLHALPKGGIVAEVGVFRGDFAQKIYDIVKPDLLYLIDKWEDKVSSPSHGLGSGCAEIVRQEKLLIPVVCTCMAFGIRGHFVLRNCVVVVCWSR